MPDPSEIEVINSQESEDILLRANKKSMMFTSWDISLNYDSLGDAAEGKDCFVMQMGGSLLRSKYAKGLNECLTFFYTGIILSHFKTLSREIGNKENDFLSLLEHNINLYSVNIPQNNDELRDDQGRILSHGDYMGSFTAQITN